MMHEIWLDFVEEVDAWIPYKLTDNIRWMNMWNATNATSTQLNQCGRSALFNEIAKNMVTTAKRTVNKWIIELMDLKRLWDLRAQMCAAFPASQCSQLKIGRFGEAGSGRSIAPNGCRKQMIVVTNPMMACGLFSDDQAPKWTKIKMNAAIVRSHVSTINIRCQANHWSLPHNWLPTHVCLK